MRVVASALGLSRSNLIERRQRQYFVRQRRRVDDNGPAAVAGHREPRS